MIKDEQQKERLLLAIQAIQTGWITSAWQAAKLYGNPKSFLQYFLWTNFQTSNLPHVTSKLTKIEENMLVQWIINMDTHEAPSQPFHIWDMANILISQQDQSGTPDTVGKNWVYKFV